MRAASAAALALVLLCLAIAQIADKSRESGTADKSRESGTADKSRESGTEDKSRESGTAKTLAPANPTLSIGLQLVRAARAQIGVTTSYDPSYVNIGYPLGDVATNTGVCTDVVIRAYRASGIDLQERVHLDMRKNFNLYPKNWGLRRPDSNIDHRRVPNLRVFFKRFGKQISIAPNGPAELSQFQPGDLVSWTLASGVPHIGIVSDRFSAEGTPLVLHNIGVGTREDDALLAFTITGHYRYHAVPDL